MMDATGNAECSPRKHLQTRPFDTPSVFAISDFCFRRASNLSDRGSKDERPDRSCQGLGRNLGRVTNECGQGKT